MIRKDGSARAIEITLQDWEQRKKFSGFSDEDAQLLQQLQPVAEAFADAVVEELYRQFLNFEETRNFFSDSAMLARVKAAQKIYFLGLTAGDYGEKYFENRLHIGRIHQKIGLTPRWYMGAYSIYAQLVFPRVIEAVKPAEKALRTFGALLKLIALDTELAITTYIAASEEVISRQAREIMEIATPVIQVWEGVVIAPLIGTLDSGRTQQFMEQLLVRLVDTKSSIALVDITGVPAIDTQTAQHLVETVSAVRLLGAQVILTGIRPAIAQTIVHLGVDLSGIVTRSSLTAGLRVAFDLAGVTVRARNGPSMPASVPPNKEPQGTLM